MDAELSYLISIKKGFKFQFFLILGEITFYFLNITIVENDI